MKLVLAWWCVVNAAADAARIFGVFVFPLYSHNVVFRRVYEELALRGHEVVVVTTDPGLPGSIPTLTEIDLSFANDFWITRKERVNLIGNPTGKDIMRTDFNILLEVTEKMLQMPQLQYILQNRTNYFDLVLTEWLFPGTFAFSKKLNCPLVGLSSMDLLPILRELAGSPSHPTLSFNFFLPDDEVSLWKRIQKVEFYHWFRNYFYNDLMPACDKLIETYMGKDVTPVQKAAKAVSLVIANKNLLLSNEQPATTVVKEVSGLHVKPPKPLPKSLQDYCDKSTNGLVYFSLGSSIKSEVISERLQEIFLQAFAELPYNVLWKFDKTNFTHVPKNVRVEKWLPQQDVLAHPNVKVFVSQGGLQSMEETIRRRVPLVGMPFVVDQPWNINRLVKLGIAVSVDKLTLTKDIFKNAIREVAQNPKYKANIVKYADLVEDRPMQAIDEAIYWIEHTIRHKHVSFPRVKYSDISWTEFLLLDIVAVTLFCTIVTITISLLALVCIKKNLKSRLCIKPKRD